jgi:predicted cytidylate kinase
MQHITINGDIGSGKSSVARELAGALEYSLASVGQFQRAIAAARGLTTLEANRLAEQLPQLDDMIDDTIIDLGRSGHPTVFDSRIAWHLIPSAFKVHLIVDPATAAARIYRYRADRTENYDSVAHAQSAADERHDSERRRFRARYGIDISLLRNYDLVIDTTHAPPAAVVAQISAELASCRSSPAKLRLSPQRVRPLPQALVPRPTLNGRGGYPVVGYRRPDVFLLDAGPEALSATDAGDLMAAILGAEGDELHVCDSV